MTANYMVNRVPGINLKLIVLAEYWVKMAE